MKYYKVINNGFVTQIGTGVYGTPISEKEYNDTFSVIQSAPTAPSGYEYKLRTDLTWELVELPPQPEPDDYHD